MSAEVTATPGAKMMYLIKRRATTSHEELVAHWFKNHMPLVIAQQERQAERGRLHAKRYLATLFNADKTGSHPWDGVAQLWWDRALPQPDEPYGTKPTDAFQQKAEPYLQWATREYVAWAISTPFHTVGAVAHSSCTNIDAVPTVAKEASTSARTKGARPIRARPTSSSVPSTAHTMVATIAIRTSVSPQPRVPRRYHQLAKSTQKSSAMTPPAA